MPRNQAHAITPIFTLAILALASLAMAQPSQTPTERPASGRVPGFLSVPGYQEGTIPDLGLRPAQRELLFGQLQRYKPHGLGYRVELNRRYAFAYPTVMIVRDLASFVDAMSLWVPTDRFPILIDDGTPKARRDIARFVRMFRHRMKVPVEIVRWQTPSPREITDPRAEVESALSRAFTASVPRLSARQYMQLLATARKPPTGVVVADPDHPAWIGAFALAMAHNQAIVWVDTPRAFDNAASYQTVVDLERQIEQELDAVGVRWNEEGDMIEGVTLLLDICPKYKGPDGQFFATTDFIGRLANDPTRRWGWASQFHGEAPDAAYRVMANLFCDARRAWLFDSYPEEAPWNRYSLKRILEAWGSPRWEVEHDAPPDGGSRTRFLSRGDTPLHAEAIFINTKGQQDRFELSPGLGRPGDLPILHSPAGVYFVHSWSAANVSNPRTVAGRWFERGVFAYAGSVEEPTLGGFEEPYLVAGRLRLPAPWGAAARRQSNQPWKIAVFGDPLWTPGPGQNPSRKAFPFEDTTPLDAEVAPAAKEGDYANAVEILHMLDRDEDAVRLVRSAIADDPANRTADLAAAGIAPAFHHGDRDLVIELFRSLDADRASDPAYQDILWHAARRRLVADADEDLLSLLRASVRAGQETTDVADLLTPWKRVFGERATVGMLEQMRDEPGKSDRWRTSFDKLIDRARAG